MKGKNAPESAGERYWSRGVIKCGRIDAAGMLVTSKLAAAHHSPFLVWFFLYIEKANQL
jgi:hypothetical protein